MAEVDVICNNHRTIVHRDGKPPWCENCGLTAGFRVPESIFDRYKKDEPAKYEQMILPIFLKE